MNKHQMNCILKYLKECLNIESEIEIDKIYEIMDGSLNVTIKSENPELDGKCYYINWGKLYKIYEYDKF